VAAAAGCTLHQIASALYRSDPEKPSVIEGGGGTRTVMETIVETIVAYCGYTLEKQIENNCDNGCGHILQPFCCTCTEV